MGCGSNQVVVIDNCCPEDPGSGAIAIGILAGASNQAQNGIAIGSTAASKSQGIGSIAIGSQASCSRIPTSGYNFKLKYSL